MTKRNLKDEVHYTLTSAFGDSYVDHELLIGLLEEMMERIQVLEFKANRSCNCGRDE
ncbi:hypothetical protein SCRM01_265 [Synechococcus phage S-CRM01]|uniref:hypothetical protein n=1 Tax=Synechococcus phage S-CRM01 TaxID=1026955 RepID=UPI000209E305|nr:hypothetical protein SCRM01_265 [Synechococcus phage S-CRM01]AEC53211.1 hypothetical protein SCRM01_265 [Synechococcus phage S-CRM01]